MEDIPKEDLNEKFSKLNLQSANSQSEGAGAKSNCASNNGISVSNEGSNSRNVNEQIVPINLPDKRNENENFSNEASSEHNVHTSRFPATDGTENRIRSILELHDGDLTFIAYKLKLEAKLKFAKVCRRFYTIMQTTVVTQYFNLNLQHVYHCSFLLEDFFSLVGHAVLVYLSNGTYGSFALRDYYQYMTALKRLRFRKHDLDPGYLNDLLPKMSNITNLCFYRCEFDDEDSYAFSEMPNLTHLSIVENEEILGHHIYLCANLVELRLRKCKAVEVSNFANFCYKLKRLEVLDVVDCCEVAYEEVFYNLQNLRKICLSCKLDRIQYEMMAEMPLIREIEIACYKVDLTQRLLHALLERKIDDIQSLKITYPKKVNVSLRNQTYLLSNFTNLREISWRSSHCDDTYFCRSVLEGMPYLHSVCLVGVAEFSVEEFEGMLSVCPFIKYVDVRFCEFVTNEYIFEAIVTLMERHQARQIMLDEAYFKKRQLQLKLPDQPMTPEEKIEKQKKLLEKIHLQNAPSLPISFCLFMVFGTNVTEDIAYDPEFDDFKEYLFLDFTNRCHEESDSEGEWDSEGEEWLETDDNYYISDLYPDIY